jgi:hypothetical protein
MENQTLQKARQGKLSPLEAVKIVDQEIGGISAAYLNPGAKNYRILNHNQIITLPTRGANKKQLERMEEVLVLAYHKAQENGSLRPGEIHLGKGCSTKHYKKGLNNYINELLQAYQN